jgi:aspartyl/asparaginyl beta-hydroxylase (cupin superfamily)
MDCRALLREAQEKIHVAHWPLYSHAEKQELFPHSAVLEMHWKLIAEECANVMKLSKRYSLIDDNQTLGSDWNVYSLIYMNQEVTPNVSRVPITMHLLRQAPHFQIRNAYFSILGPHSGISPHKGYMNSVLRYHLGLHVPEKCHLCIGSLRVQWKDGEGILWDDMFTHCAHNESSLPRAILFLDIVRKDLTEEQKLLDDQSVQHVVTSKEFNVALEQSRV